MAIGYRQDDLASLLIKSLATIKQLRADVEKQKNNMEQVAVIGMGCRFPGGCRDPQTFWGLLEEGRDGIGEIPGNRWSVEDFYDPNPGVPGKMYLKEAGFLQEDVGEFDARFFGISPREAVEMDPQQRLLLEVSWEALERAGISASQIKGTQTGVFVGIIGSEYGVLPRDTSKISPFSVTGTITNIASGRISYILGVHGPSISLDTACSSSLVAVHLACESLLRGESSMALAGGVNLMLSPLTFASLCELHALSVDGRCRTFDANGDGYGRGEGCGVVVLKRLSDAMRDKDPILAVIRGTGVNQDGTGSGLTVPNGAAQKELINRTLTKARVSPSDIGYFEAHGTGTALGDPIEVQALTEVFGNDESRHEPLIIGAVKSNIGHLEASAGIAGLIKVVLCLQNKAIPPNLHLNTINPRIRLEKIPAIVPTDVIPWETLGKQRVAGISSFGFSGTNAFAVISESPVITDSIDDLKPSCDRPLHVLAISAKDENALSQLVVKYITYFGTLNGEQLENICYTANVGRTHFAHRIAFIAESLEQMKQNLSDYAKGNSSVRIIERRGQENTSRKLVFLFSSNFNKRVIKCLVETQAVFKQTLMLCNEQLQRLVGSSFLEYILIDDLHRNNNSPVFLDDVVSFSYQYSLFKLWESWGVKPKAVLGFAIGELVAACASGIMGIDTALAFIVKKYGFTGDGAAGDLNQPQIRLISGVSGCPIEKQQAISRAYWATIFTGEAKLEEGIQYLYKQGFKTFLGIGTEVDHDHQNIIKGLGMEYFPSVLADDPWKTLTKTLAHLYCLGWELKWSGFDENYIRHKVILPTYPFLGKRYWAEFLPFSVKYPDRTEMVKQEETNSFLDGKIISSPGQEKQIEYCLRLSRVPDLKDTHGMLHTGYYLELLCRAVSKIYNTTFLVKTIEFLAVLVISENEPLNISLILTPEDNEHIAFSFYSNKGNNSWNKHAQGKIQLAKTNSVSQVYTEKRTDIENRCTTQYSGLMFYHRMQDRGLPLGKSVQWIDSVWSRDGEALARFRPPLKYETPSEYKTGVHPGVFDACAQLFHAALPESADEDMRYMVVKWEDFESNIGIVNKELWCHVVLTDSTQAAGNIIGVFNLFNQDGILVAKIKSGNMKGISKELGNALQKALASSEDLKENQKQSGLLSTLRSSAPLEWEGIIDRCVQQIFSSILNMEISDLDINEPLMNLGLNSLVTVEAKTKIERELGISLSLEILIQGPSIRELTKSIIPLLMTKTDQIYYQENDAVAPGYKKDINLWIVHRKHNKQAKIKLFCFPYGSGGGASLYREWQEKLPDFIEVCPLQLPGKENRIKEKAFSHIDRAVETLEKVLLSEIDRPYAFYGHSMGALIVYRLAYKLWKDAVNKPKHVFVGAYTSPSILPNPGVTSARERFQARGFIDIPNPDGISPETLEEAAKIFNSIGVERGVESSISEELSRLLLPTRLAEINMVKSFDYRDDIIFDIPVTAFHGIQDDFVSEEEMNAWRVLTKGVFKLYKLPGDHFFLHKDQDQEQLIQFIAQELGQIKDNFWS